MLSGEEMKLAVVTDSVSDISPEIAKKLNITVVPLTVIFGTEQYLDGIDLSNTDFFKRLNTDPNHPSTSQPSPDAFVQTYKKLLDKGFEILSVHVSAKLSGTINSAEQAISTLGTDKVIIVDTGTASMAQGLTAMSAARAAKSAKSLKELESIAVETANKTNVFVAMDTMEFLRRGGRIGKARAMLGSILNIKPIITTVDGEIVPHSRARTIKKAMSTMISDMGDINSVSEIAILHGNVPEVAEELVKQIDSSKLDQPITVTGIGPVVGTHAGPGCIALAFSLK
jgi:DegV family protein with EDD domain|tara:strand:- start:85 stop:936 length:852 start_codon:yes stop_codon:yes gene_type:complete